MGTGGFGEYGSKFYAPTPGGGRSPALSFINSHPENVLPKKSTDARQGKQGVALTGRNTTGPPSRAAPGELHCRVECYRRQTTTEAREQNNTGPFTLLCRP